MNSNLEKIRNETYGVQQKRQLATKNNLHKDIREKGMFVIKKKARKRNLHKQ